MSAAVLSRLFVDVTARGIGSTSAQVRQFSGAMKEVEKISAQAEKAVSVMNQAVSMTGAAIRTVLVPLGALSASLVALTRAGLQGTVQLYQLNRQFQLFTREIAAAMLPAVELVIAGMKRLNQFIRDAGLTGQNAFLKVGIVLLSLTAGLTAGAAVLGAVGLALSFIAAMAFPLAAVAFVLASAIGLVVGGFVAMVALSPNLRAALGRLWEAVRQLARSFEPVVTGLLNIGGLMLNTFVIEPVIVMVKALTTLVQVLDRVYNRLKLISPLLMVLGYVGRQSQAPDVPTEDRRRVTLDQTGQESGEQTFQRIQQEILRIQAGEEDVPRRQLIELEAIRAAVEAVANMRGGAPAANPAPFALGQNDALAGDLGNAAGRGIDAVLARGRR